MSTQKKSKFAIRHGISQILPMIVVITVIVCIYALTLLNTLLAYSFILIITLLNIIFIKVNNAGKIFTKSLGAYFLVHKYPWSKYHFIGQRKGIEQSPDKSCRQIIADFNKQGDIALSKMKSGKTYLMYTHTTIIHQLRRVSRFKLTEFNDRSTLPLMPNFKELTGRNCDKCPTSHSCLLVKTAQRNTVFRTVKIEVKK